MLFFFFRESESSLHLLPRDMPQFLSDPPMDLLCLLCSGPPGDLPIFPQHFPFAFFLPSGSFSCGPVQRYGPVSHMVGSKLSARWWATETNVPPPCQTRLFDFFWCVLLGLPHFRWRLTLLRRLPRAWFVYFWASHPNLSPAFRSPSKNRLNFSLSNPFVMV